MVLEIAVVKLPLVNVVVKTSVVMFGTSVLFDDGKVVLNEMVELVMVLSVDGDEYVGIAEVETFPSNVAFGLEKDVVVVIAGL